MTDPAPSQGLALDNLYDCPTTYDWLILRAHFEMVKSLAQFFAYGRHTLHFYELITPGELMFSSSNCHRNEQNKGWTRKTGEKVANRTGQRRLNRAGIARGQECSSYYRSRDRSRRLWGQMLLSGNVKDVVRIADTKTSAPSWYVIGNFKQWNAEMCRIKWIQKK
jgi:hypothetical protein